MAAKKKQPGVGSTGLPKIPSVSPPASAAPQDVDPIPTTGRFLVLIREGQVDSAIAELRRSAGVTKVALSADYASNANAVDMEEVHDADVIVYNKLGVA